MSMRENEIPYTVESAYLRPREPFALYSGRTAPQEPPMPKTPQKERLVLTFDIPAEEDTEVNYTGTCGCDKCRESSHPVELYRGKTTFHLDGKEIYCDCLQDYLEARMRII